MRIKREIRIVAYILFTILFVISALSNVQTITTSEIIFKDVVMIYLAIYLVSILTVQNLKLKK